MQLAAAVVGVVHAADARAQLEAQGVVVTEPGGQGTQVLAPHEEGDLAAVDHDALDRRLDAGGAGGLGQRGRDVVHPAAVGGGVLPGICTGRSRPP